MKKIKFFNKKTAQSFEQHIDSNSDILKLRTSNIISALGPGWEWEVAKRSIEDLAEDIIDELHTYAKGIDPYEYGLPMSAEEGDMKNIVKKLIEEFLNQ